jgi:hypothetical protein
LSANPRSSTIIADNTSILITTEPDNRPAEGATAPSVAQHTVELSLATVASASEALSPSTDYLPVESGTPAPPTAYCQAEMSPTKKALHDANDAMKTMNIYDTWDNAVSRIKWVMDTVSPVAGVRTLSFFAYP